jgi:hypothetical protein
VTLADRPHPLAAATGHRLEQHRQAVLVDERLEAGEVVERLQQPRDERHSGRPGELAGLGLRAHQPDRRRRRADPGQSGRLHRLGEAGVLGQEAVAGMDEVGAGAPGRVEQALDREVAFRRRRRTDAEGLVRHQDVRRHPVDLGVDGHRRDVHLPAGADDPDRDLAAVGDEQLHRHPPTQGLGSRIWGLDPAPPPASASAPFPDEGRGARGWGLAAPARIDIRLSCACSDRQVLITR